MDGRQYHLRDVAGVYVRLPEGLLHHDCREASAFLFRVVAGVLGTEYKISPVFRRTLPERLLNAPATQFLAIGKACP